MLTCNDSESWKVKDARTNKLLSVRGGQIAPCLPLPRPPMLI